MRLFVGLSLPGDIRARLRGLEGGLSGARWIADENLHLSLRFIGDVTGGGRTGYRAGPAIGDGAAVRCDARGAGDLRAARPGSLGVGRGGTTGRLVRPARPHRIGAGALRAGAGTSQIHPARDAGAD